MSGILKGVAKVFKKVVSSKVFKIVAIAAAIYFTGGLAAGAMGSAFATTLPGIQAAASALGITAGAFGEGAMALAGVIDAGTVLGANAVMDAEAAITGSAALMDAAPAVGSGLVNGGVADVTGGVNAANAGTFNTVSASPGIVGSQPPVPSGLEFKPYTPAPVSAPTPATSATAPASFTSPVQSAPEVTGAITPAEQSSFMKYVNDPANSFTVKALLQGMSTGGAAAVNAIGQKSTADAISARDDQTRADIIRRGGVPSLAGLIKKPGIVSNGIGG